MNNPIAEKVSRYLKAIDFDERIANHEELCLMLEPWLAKRTKRGLLLFGRPGVGKTYLCQRVLGGLRTIPVQRLVMQLAEQANSDRDVERFGDMAIDDLGTEQLAYGKNFVPLLIDLRWRAFENGASTWFTTNLSWEEMKQRYDGRVLSRLMGMADPITMNGADQRIAATGGEGKK